MHIQRVSNNNKIAFGLKLRLGGNLAESKQYGFVPEEFIDKTKQIAQKVEDVAPYDRTVFLDFEKDIFEDYYRWVLKAFSEDKETKVKIPMLSKPKGIDEFFKASAPAGKIEYEAEKLAREMKKGDA